MQTTIPYQRLSSTEREEVSRSLAQGSGLSAIARRLGRAPSTVTREVRHNSGKSGYRAFSAGNRANLRASSRNQGKSRLTRDDRLRGYVMEKLQKRWSPREIVKRLAVEYPGEKTMRISHETIYRYIYVLPRGALKTTLIQALRQARAYRRPRKSQDHEETRGKLVAMLSIEERPHEVADRTLALGTLVERTTRYTLLVPLKAKDATSVRKAYAKALRSLPREITKTLTYDQGKEMSEHKQFTIDTGITVYFAHPGAPWERGTNENTNGLLRQYFPKGTEFNKVSTREIKRVQRELNDRPRAALHWQKPTEVINYLVALNV
ncbi:MAG: Transposase, family [Nitrospira sp.]|nr:Transposase, family [Nitrospira sp.]